ncbi:MAG: hypothetical protein DCC68_03125 [Planctomycetota bacterium]|nr:MAG: hypothetical protein DCC68_03125 [Planctomycetota bacterium]
MTDDSPKSERSHSTQPSPAPPGSDRATPPGKHDSTVVWPRATDASSSTAASSTGSPSIESIGKYRVIGALDSGGQGDVYRALHPQLQKELLIKVGRRELADAGEEHDRLIAEGRILAALDHPHLAHVYDLDFHERRPFLVMEYIRGCNLRQHAGGEAISWREAARLCSQTARALAAAHARGVLHLDVKPENIIVDEKGAARLIDFGLARLRHAWSNDPTPSGTVSGTIPFMAPEQARGETDRLDRRTDVFALGAVLYWLLTGKPPFGTSLAPNALVAAQNCTFDRSLVERCGARRSLVDICLKTLSAEPSDRFPSADALAEALERTLVPNARAWKIASISVGNLGCALTITACTLFVAVGYAIWDRNLRSGHRDEVAVAAPASKQGDDHSAKPGEGHSFPESMPPDSAVPAPPDSVPPVPSPVEPQATPDLVRSAKVTPGLRGYVIRGNSSTELVANETPVAVHAERLRFEVELPTSATPALFVFDGLGSLERHEMRRGAKVSNVSRWTWEGSLALDGAEQRSPSTIVAVVCAKRIDVPADDPSSHAPPALDAVRELLDPREAWPYRAGSWLVAFDADDQTISPPLAPDEPPDARAFRDALRGRAKAVAATLARRFRYVRGLAFPVGP